MNKFQSNDLNVLVNIKYGIGFQLIKGKIGIETTFFNRTHRSKIVPANKNRINFNEEFLWTIDKNTLKYCQTTNEMVKVECFKMSGIYGNIYQPRQRIGHIMIKLQEFQMIGPGWDLSSVPLRRYKLYGSNRNYTFLIILIIQDGLYSNDSRKIEKRLRYSCNPEYMLREIKNNLRTKKLKKNSKCSIRNSSTQTESNLKQQNEQRTVILRYIKSKLNELIEYINKIVKITRNINNANL